MHNSKSVHTKGLSFVFLILFSTVFLSCSEDPSKDLQIEDRDKDMILAEKMADEFLNSLGQGARSSYKDKNVTVLKFKDDLTFNTNTQTGTGYTEIFEETITAETVPGSYIFWQSGGGVNELVGIEFDEDSQFRLREYPGEAKEGKMWYVFIPDNIEFEDDEEYIILKYDILYIPKKGDGQLIRLDPKIKINH
jgi:hypothetical protein